MDAFRHPKLPGAIFRPIRRNPALADDELKLPAVADQLGTSRRDVKDAIATGLITAARSSRGDLVVEGKELAKFTKQLQPVTVADAPATAEPPEARPVEPPAAPPGQPGNPAVRPALATAVAPAAQLVDDDTDQGPGDQAATPDWMEVDCPTCRVPLAIATGVLRLRCPGCGHALTVLEDGEEPEPEQPPRFGFFGRRR